MELKISADLRSLLRSIQSEALHGICTQTLFQSLRLAVTVVQIHHDVAVASRPRAFQSINDQTMSRTRLVRLNETVLPGDFGVSILLFP